jgi:hypothetical protein
MELLVKIAEEILSQTGLAVFLLFAGVIYLGHQLMHERTNREKDRALAREEAKVHAAAFMKISDALMALSVTIARLEGSIDGRRGHGH